MSYNGNEEGALTGDAVFVLGRVDHWCGTDLEHFTGVEVGAEGRDEGAVAVQCTGLQPPCRLVGIVLRHDGLITGTSVDGRARA